MNKLSIARKELSRTEADGKETIVNEIIRFEFDKSILDIIWIVFDDWEYAQNHGVYQDEDGDIYLIDVDMILDELDNRIEDNGEEDSDNDIEVKKYLEKYKGFKIWVV